MTETTESLDTTTADTSTSGRGRARRGEGLSGMVLPDLKALAGQLGIRGTSGMRKGDLVAAIAARQNGAGAAAPKQDAPRTSRGSKPATRSTGENGTAAGTNGHTSDPQLPLGDLARGPESRDTETGGASASSADTRAPAEPAERSDQGQPEHGRADQAPSEQGSSDQGRVGDGRDRGPADTAADSSGDSDDAGRSRRNRRGRRDGREFTENGAAPTTDQGRAPQEPPAAATGPGRAEPRSQNRDGQNRDGQNRDQNRNGQRDGQGPPGP